MQGAKADTDQRVAITRERAGKRKREPKPNPLMSSPPTRLGAIVKRPASLLHHGICARSPRLTLTKPTKPFTTPQRGGSAGTAEGFVRADVRAMHHNDSDLAATIAIRMPEC